MEVVYCILVTLAVYIGKSEAIQCYECLHLTYTTSDPVIDAFLIQISSSDPNCLESGEDYFLDKTVSCDTTCYKESGTVRLRYLTGTATVTIAGRGCAPFFRSDVCTDITLKGDFEDLGFTVTSEDLDGCYCNDDECNHGNSLRADALYGMFLLAFILLRKLL